MRIAILSIVLLVSYNPWLSADLVVSWKGDYVDSVDQNLSGNAFIGSGINLDSDGNNDDEIGGRAFSSTSPFSPSSNYSGTSSRFFGGAILGSIDYSQGNTRFDGAEVKHQGPNDSVHFHASSENHQHVMNAAILWNQSDFLGGGQPIAFDATSSATFRIGSSSTNGLDNSQVRLLVRDASNNYWLSQEAMISPSANKSFTWNSSNQGFSTTSDGNWASFNPNAAIAGLGAGTDMRFDQGSAVFSDRKFTTITGVGIYFDQDTPQNNLDFHFEEFTLNASYVPEPSSLASLSLVLLVVSRIRQRKKK